MKISEISVGEVYLIQMDKANGITPKDGMEYRSKFFIVLGFDSEGRVFGGTVINSAINSNLNKIIQRCHIPISCEDYTFLRHDSYVNCSTLKLAWPEQFLENNLLGELEVEDLKRIKEALKSSPMERKANLKRFGII